MPYLGFLGRNLKSQWSYLESTLQNVSKCIFLSKARNSLYLGLKCLIWVFLGNNLKNYWHICEITILKFRKFLSFIQNKKTLKLVPKMPFWVNLQDNFKKLFSLLQAAPSNLSNIKFHVKQNNFSLRPEMLYLGTFKVRI